MEGSSRRSMENCCLVNPFEFIGGKNTLSLIKKENKQEQTAPEHHKKRRTLLVAIAKKKKRIDIKEPW